MELSGAGYAHNYNKNIQNAFGGLNHSPAAGDGEIYDMQNLCSDYYPLLATRKLRGEIDNGAKCRAMAGYDGKLFWIAGNKLLGYTPGGTVQTMQQIAAISADGRKKLAFMNGQILIWPDKVWYDVRALDASMVVYPNEQGAWEQEIPDPQPGDRVIVETDLYEYGTKWEKVCRAGGSLEAEWKGTQLTLMDGTYAGVAADANTLYAPGANWAENFEVGDAVTISGCGMNNQTSIVREIEGDYLRFYEGTFKIPTCYLVDILPNGKVCYVEVDGEKRKFMLYHPLGKGSRIYVSGKNVIAIDENGNGGIIQTEPSDIQDIEFRCTSAQYVANGTENNSSGLFCFQFNDKWWTFGIEFASLPTGIQLNWNGETNVLSFSNGPVAEHSSGIIPAEEGRFGTELSFSNEEWRCDTPNGMLEGKYQFSWNGAKRQIDLEKPYVWAQYLSINAQSLSTVTIFASNEEDAPRENVAMKPAQQFLELNSIQSDYTEYGTISVKRSAPDLDYVFQCGNRLWGCEGKTIMCSVLGNPKVWYDYDGLSDSAWACTVPEGEITGAVAYRGYPIFMTENKIMKIYGDFPSDFQMVETATLGCERGSGESFAIAGESLYYKSRIGFVCYNGGVPYSVDQALGQGALKNAIAGTDGRKYYVSCADETGAHHLLVYDTRGGLWHREDNASVQGFGTAQGLYMAMAIDDWSSRIMSVDGFGTVWEKPKSAAEFGEWVNGSTQKKQIKALHIRHELEEGATLKVLIRYDDGEYAAQQTITETGKRTTVIPIRPERHDRWNLRLEGTGAWKVSMITREFLEGSER